jgi:branched-chain amino acid transport system permease protein
MIKQFWQNNRALVVTLVVVLVILGAITQNMEPRVWVSILLSGVTLAAILFLLASGLSLIFGLMDVLNFAHGAILVFGAYIGLSAFQNPRLFFNTLPFFFAIAAGAMIARPFGHHIWFRIQDKRVQQILWWVLILLGIALIAFALRRFPIARINAFNITAVGGAVPTALAQEPMSLMIQRVIMLFAASLPLGLVMAPKDPREMGRVRPVWQPIVSALLILAGGLVLLSVRDAGEQFWLGLSVNLRFLIAIILGAAGGALIGILIEMGLIRPFYGSPVTQLVLTLGLSIVAIDMIELVWGMEGHPPTAPPSAFSVSCRSASFMDWLSENCASISILGRAFPSYRLFIIVVGLVVFISVGLLLQRSRIGMIIRAGVQDSEMVQALGINVRQVFTFVFALGSAMAALGGVIIAPFMGVYPGLGGIFQLQAFVAVVIGGMGSYTGAAIGTLLIGIARAFGDHFVASGIQLPFMELVIKGSPAVARASTVLIMILVLLVRPAGIFGKKE